MSPPNTEYPFNPGYFHSEALRHFGFGAIGENVSIAKNCTIIGPGNIFIGNHVRIDGHTTIVAHTGTLTLGSHIHIGGGAHISCATDITLHDFSGLSQNVCLYSATDDYSGKGMTNPMVPKAFLAVHSAPITLKKHVIIGSGSIVLPGVTIEEGSAVGALSLVNHSLEAWGVYSGIPVKYRKPRSREIQTLEAQFTQEKAHFKSPS